MRFCPWYPLRDAAAHAPAEPNILQVRLAAGLRGYPRGKSAMVHYEHAEDARAAAGALAARWPDRELLCRHLEREDVPPPDLMAATYDKLAAEFLRRFGALPSHGEPDADLAADDLTPDEAAP